jgi:hypothetical protein
LPRGWRAFSRREEGARHGPVGPELSGSDSLVVQFNIPGTDTISNILNATDRNAINELIGFIDSKNALARKCRYDGNLMFYKKGNLTGDVSFNYTADSCRQFIMELNGELIRSQMSNKAADFLRSLSEQQKGY